MTRLTQRSIEIREIFPGLRARIVHSARTSQSWVEIDAQKVQLKISRVPARRAINSRATSRGPVDELIISNVLDAVRPRMVKASLKSRRRLA